MRNLKRALSLALAAIMVLGLMVVGASAAGYDSFTDKDTIVHKEAVSMITELGILAGLPDGSFGSTQNIDRASFARLVCVVLNGGQEPVLGNLTTSFKDTQGNWAEKYIAFCVDRGIIAGRGNNTFGPSDNVTGSEAAKMLLVALGYNAGYEGIGGSTWEITTNSLANMAGLYKGLETINPSQPLTRDNAAQMIYNVLNAQTVTYSFTYNANGTTTAVQNKTGKTMLEDKFNAIKVEGVVTANEYANLESTADKGAALDAGKTRIDVTNYGTNEDQKVFNDGIYAVSTGADVLGKSVVLYVKNDSNNSSKATVLGNAIVSDDNVVVTKANNNLLSKIADDSNLTIKSTTPVLINYTQAVDYSKYDDTQKVRGVEKTLIDNNDDGNVDYILVNTFYFGVVDKLSTKDDGSITVDIGKAWKSMNLTADDKDDVVGFEDVAVDDYVLAAWIGGKLHVEKAESVTGTLEAYKAGESLTVDGTAYDVSQVVGYTGGDDAITAAKNVGSGNLSNEATFYLDKNGMIVAMGEATENAANYAFVWATDKGGNLDAARAKVTLQDGTTATYTLASGSALKDTDLNTTLNTENRIYSYTINSDGELKLTAPKGGYATGSNGDFDKGKTTVPVTNATSSQTKYASNSTIFFYVNVKDGKVDSVNVYTGYTNAPSVDKVNAQAAYNNAGKMAAVAFNGALTNNDVAEFLYVTSIGSSTSDYTTVKAILPGTDEAVEIKVNDNAFSTKGLYLYSVDSKGNYDLTTPTDASLTSANYLADANVDYISGTTVVVTGTGAAEYKVTDKTVLVELDKDGGFVNAYVGKLPSNSDKGLVTTMLYNNDKEILLIVTKEAAGSTVVTPDSKFDGKNVAVVDNNAGTVTINHYGTKPAAAAAVALVKAADANIKSVDSTNYSSNKLTVTTVAGDTYELTVKFTEYFLVKYNGNEVGYFKTTDKDFELASNATAVINTTDATAASAYQTVSSNKFTVDVSALTADLNLKDAAQITAQTNASAATFGTTKENANEITAGTTYVAAGTKVFVKASANDKAITATGAGAPALTVEVAPSASAQGIYSFTMPATTVGADAFTQAS